MKFIIPGSLPPSPIMHKLIPLIAKQAPVFYGFLKLAQHKEKKFDSQANACTPYEGWQLIHAGFQPTRNQPLGAGLGPLLAGLTHYDKTGPVWLAELVHFSVSNAKVMLLDPAIMELHPKESFELLSSIRSLHDSEKFMLEEVSAQRWRVHLPQGIVPLTMSPCAIAGRPLEGFWRSNSTKGFRHWRKFLNTVQMVWHNHRVNKARVQRGLPTINGLWLYGGASPWTISTVHKGTVITDLDKPYRTRDWSNWLESLAIIEKQYILPLATALGHPVQHTRLLLIGCDRWIELTLRPCNRLLNWIKKCRKKKGAWWLYHI